MREQNQNVALLEWENLSLSFATDEGDDVDVLHDVDLALHAGETLALVGESGSGKSVTALSALDLLGPSARLRAGRLKREGDVVWDARSDDRRALRGDFAAAIFQDPMSSLTPFMRVGDQIAEGLVVGKGMTPKRARARAVELLRDVEIDRPEVIANWHPHRLSGGMQQRVMIAMALAREPRVLIADEPTTALDVTTQARVLDLIARLARERGTAVLFITHDLGAASGLADRVAVLEQGRVVEVAPSARLFAAPEHPRTRALLAALPRLGDREDDAPQDNGAATAEPLVRLRGVTLGYGRGPDIVPRLDLDLLPGEVLGLVGESGSGKSTVLRAVAGLLAPRSGQILIAGLGENPSRRARAARLQMVFQDPFGALNPRRRILDSVLESAEVQGWRGDRQARAKGLLEEVDLPAVMLDRYPHELSGGQLQRVGIARALAADPEGLLLDEATSALDVSVQAQVLELLLRLRAERGLAYLFVTHDLAVLDVVADRVVVMQKGEIVEAGPRARVLRSPEHPYARRLLDAVPRLPDP